MKNKDKTLEIFAFGENRSTNISERESPTGDRKERMSKLFQRIKRWISGATAALLMVGILLPGITSATLNLATISVDSLITNDSTPEITGRIVSPTDTLTVTVDGVPYDNAINNTDGTWVLPDGAITSDLLDGIYEVEASTSSGATDTTVNELTVDTAAPMQTSVSIFSNNSKNSKWAKPGDVVYVKVLADEAIMGVDATIGGRAANLVSYGDGIKAYRVMDGLDVEGVVGITINYTDLAGNPGVEVIEVTDTSSVTFDKTAPELFAKMSDYWAKFPPASQSLATQNYLNETDLEPLEGVYVSEETRVVDVRTIWEIDKTKSTTLPVYKVTYTAEDQAGNLAAAKKEMALTTGATDAAIGNLLPVLNGVTPLVPSAERGKVYVDEGVTLDWRTSISEAVKVWVYGDLDLSKVTIQDGHQLSVPYVLGYRAHDAADSTLDGTKKVEREISVEDNLGPAAVANLTAYAGNGYVQLTWTNPIDEDFAGLDVYRSTVSGVRGDKVASALSVTTKSFDDYTVVNGETYYYVVVAYDIYANASKDSAQVTANPVSPKVAAASYYDYTVEAAAEEEQEVKADETVKPDEVKTESAVPVIGIIILVLLIVLGLYLLYLQNPKMFGWLAFWKRNKKGSINLGAAKKSKTTKTNTNKSKTKK